jgi:regulator of protease activity HflC (stomatin/prohibitin superfamily)
MADDVFPSALVIGVIVLIIAAVISIIVIRRYRQRNRQGELRYEHLSPQQQQQQQASRRDDHARGDKSGIPLKMPNLSKVENKLKILAAVVTVVVIIVVLSESVVIVEAGHRGAVLYLGAVEPRVLSEGLHFITPFAEQVIPMEVRTLKFQADASAASNDLQEVQTVIALNYHIDPNRANIIFQQLGSDYADRIISPTIQESVKASVAKFNAEELITKRETAKGVIADTIRKTLSERDISVETVFITDFKFSEAFSNQIEAKVVAYQKYLTEQNNLKSVQVVANQTVVQAEAQARANVAKANGESQAIKIINEQLKQSPEYLKWQSINKWNGQMPSVLGTNAFPFFELPVQPQQNQTRQ